eukprot:COSAG01_NODE_40846_length_459_cov_0.497222_1_plen_65_part_10
MVDNLLHGDNPTLVKAAAIELCFHLYRSKLSSQSLDASFGDSPSEANVSLLSRGALSCNLRAYAL